MPSKLVMLSCSAFVASWSTFIGDSDERLVLRWRGAFIGDGDLDEGTRTSSSPAVAARRRARDAPKSNVPDPSPSSRLTAEPCRLGSAKAGKPRDERDGVAMDDGWGMYEEPARVWFGMPNMYFSGSGELAMITVGSRSIFFFLGCGSLGGVC